MAAAAKIDENSFESLQKTYKHRRKIRKFPISSASERSKARHAVQGMLLRERRKAPGTPQERPWMPPNDPKRAAQRPESRRESSRDAPVAQQAVLCRQSVSKTLLSSVSCCENLSFFIVSSLCARFSCAQPDYMKIHEKALKSKRPELQNHVWSVSERYVRMQKTTSLGNAVWS